jgi:protein-L-isoaspartate O-methyltransferase
MTLARFLRRLYPTVPLVTGGYHASALPEDFLFDGSPFSAVIPGEGERGLLLAVQQVLGGLAPAGTIGDRQLIEEMDHLPPYRWELLQRYWPRAQDIGRKFQIYLARGCPYRCTFCMERTKGSYKWRAFSAERAVDELTRLSRFTDLGQWVINIADPLFGFQRQWRRDVLESILRRKLLPRQYWTLTRADDLDRDDVRLLAQARFSIGIGAESGSPEMLSRMKKGNQPERYLEALMRLAELSREFGLTWAANIIVGHPGETLQTMRETRAYFGELFGAARETCGWLSIDPFRLYPGSYVYESMDDYERELGTQFHHPRWWQSWYDAPFQAEHVDPSHELDFETRVQFMYENYAPLVGQIIDRFRGQGRSVDRIFRRSLAEQAALLSSESRATLLHRARAARTARPAPGNGVQETLGELLPLPGMPIGLQVRDSRVRAREDAVRRLLENGALRSTAVVESLLAVKAEQYLAPDEVDLMFADVLASDLREGDVAPWLGISTYALALEAMNPGTGDRVVDLLAHRGYFAAVLAQLVGREGKVVVLGGGGRGEQRHLRRALSSTASVELVSRRSATAPDLVGPFDGMFLGAALPRFPDELLPLLVEQAGRAVVFLGPRFRAQDMVCATSHQGQVVERVVARIRIPVLMDGAGWLIPRRNKGLLDRVTSRWLR